ncbi:MAG: fasciclin domain-containing protein [Raineya sp.]
MQGAKLKVSVQGENITIGNIKVVAADIYAKNGVIHAIEGVIE